MTFSQKSIKKTSESTTKSTDFNNLQYELDFNYQLLTQCSSASEDHTKTHRQSRKNKLNKMHNQDKIQFCLDFEDQNFKFNPHNKWQIQANLQILFQDKQLQIELQIALRMLIYGSLIEYKFNYENEFNDALKKYEKFKIQKIENEFKTAQFQVN